MAAGADVRARTDGAGFGPLHLAIHNRNALASAAAVQALLAAGADVLANYAYGHTSLRTALALDKPQAAEALLAAMPTEAALMDLCSPTTALARQLLPAFIADRLPLTDAQWALIPIAPRPGPHPARRPCLFWRPGLPAGAAPAAA